MRPPFGNKDTYMKRILTGILAIMLSTASSAQSDSVRLISVPKWKLERLLDNYFFIAPSCDSTVIAYQVALQKADSAINSANKVILLRTQQRDLKVLESETLASQIAIGDKIHKQELKQAKSKGFKTGSITTGIVSILVIVLIL